MRAPESEAFVAFVRKWQAREPEMLIAETFCPPERKPLYRAWGALLHELREAVFELSDPRVTEVKTGWWAEELIGMSQGRHRHPITEILVGHAAPWSELGRSLLELPDSGRRHATTDETIDSLLPTAHPVIAVESALFATTPSEAAGRSLVVHWLTQRLPQGLAAEDQARIPMHLMARHGVGAAELAAGQGEALLRDWAAELSARLPAELPAVYAFRLSRTRFDRARLQRLAAGKGFTEPPPLATLWRAWRAARASNL
jgi:phytoene/squalene synthetase